MEAREALFKYGRKPGIYCSRDATPPETKLPVRCKGGSAIRQEHVVNLKERRLTSKELESSQQPSSAMALLKTPYRRFEDGDTQRIATLFVSFGKKREF